MDVLQAGSLTLAFAVLVGGLAAPILPGSPVHLRPSGFAKPPPADAAPALDAAGPPSPLHDQAVDKERHAEDGSHRDSHEDDREDRHSRHDGKDRDDDRHDRDGD